MSAQRGLGPAYLQRLVQRDFAWIEAHLHPEIAFRALVPSGLREAQEASGAVGWLRRWFGEREQRGVLYQTIEEQPGGFWLSYRLLVREGEALQTVEQHALCREREGRIDRMDLLCSGFQEVQEVNVEAGFAGTTTASTTRTGEATQAPVADAVLDAPGEGCATLTPLIRTRIRELESGQTLEVRTDDPTARENLEAWCRLSGNMLLASVADGTGSEHFFIRKK